MRSQSELVSDGKQLFPLLPLHCPHNLTVEYLLLDTFGEVVGDYSHEHPLRERGNHALRNKAVHLRENRAPFVATRNTHAPYLQDRSATLCPKNQS